MTERRFAFPLAEGLHARPAAALGAWAQGRPLVWENTRNGRRAPLGSVLDLLATDTRPGDPCRLLAEDAEALADWDAFFAGPFRDTGPAPAGGAAPRVPRILARVPTPWWAALPVVDGLGEGPACFLPDARPAEPPAGDPPQARLAEALATLRTALDAEAAQAYDPEIRAILQAHRALAEDDGWAGAMLRSADQGALAAVRLATEAACARLLASDQALLRARALDLQGLGERLAGILAPPAPDPAPDGILLAPDLTPTRLLGLDRSRLRGLVLGEGGAASHTAILARAFGIPCVALAPLPAGLAPGTPLLVEGRRGLLVQDAPPEVRAYLGREAEGRAFRQARREAAAGPVRTRDGHPLRLLANLACAEEAEGAFRAGAQGVGLLRTELLFLDRREAPSVAAQAEAYGRVLRAADGRPVVLRLLDAGGDKPLPFLPLPREANPFLGRRGVRWYPQHAGLVRAQVAAALGAGPGELRLMVPMVADPEELAWVRALVAEEAARLGRPAPPVGMMVEVPAAALNLRAFGAADFFSVGTNDLLQYLFAEDRNEPALARRDRAWHPAALRVLAGLVRDAAALGKEVSLCGELASDPRLLPLLAGLGFRSLSVAPAALPALAEAAARLELPACRTLADRALEADGPGAVEALLEAFVPAAPDLPLLDPDLVVLDEACATREEAIRLLVERLAATGRVPDADALEAAVWAREDTCATAIGHGLAVPHGHGPGAGGLALLRLRAPLDWGGSPVRLVLLLASAGAAEHLRAFARLARRLMDPAFREALETAPAPADAVTLLETLNP